jgi:hypothetical protein
MPKAISVTIRDSISGSPRIIKNPLRARHVKVGRFFWYDGHTSISSWSCPGVITQVDDKKKRFRIRSLDDMREQDQWYDFDVNEHSETSRQTMRLVPRKEVRQYLKKHEERHKQKLALSRTTLSATKKGLESFQRLKKELGFK